MKTTQANSTVTASYTYENWRRFRRGEPWQGATEAMLFTDTWVTGEIADLGPYALLNTIAHAANDPGKVLKPAVVVRLSHHYEGIPAHSSLPMEDNFDHYHGGDYLDEIAALVSLFLGARFKAGGVNREFEKDGSRFGRPIQYGDKPDPQLLPQGQTQIPRLKESVNLNAGLQPLHCFPRRTAGNTNTLIKAARQYQQAIWIADSDPSLAWLMLVSSIETAAVEWWSTSTPVEQLEDAFPDLVELIRNSSSPELLDPIAGILDRLTRATKRFVDFVAHFAPGPPATRPLAYMQFSYDASNLKKSISLIYGHRSMSLHNGTAFPLPMYQPPRPHPPNPVPQEVPFGLAMAARGASWKRERTPMLLNTFEHIARGTLMNWWNSLESSATSSELERSPDTRP